MGATRLASEKMQLLFSRGRFTLLSLSRRGTRRPIRGSAGCLSLSQNGIIRQHKTQAQNASTNGGDASRVGKDAAII